MIERKTLLKVSKTSYPAQLHCEEYNDKSPYCFELGDISVSVHLGAKSPGCAIISSNVKGPLNEPYVLIPTQLNLMEEDHHITGIHISHGL